MKYKRLVNYEVNIYKISDMIHIELVKVGAIEMLYYISLFILYFNSYSNAACR